MGVSCAAPCPPPKLRHGSRREPQERGAPSTTDIGGTWHQQWVLSEASRSLLQAAQAGDVAGAERSLKGLAVPDCCDSAGLTPLHAAAGGGNAEIVRLLLQRKASPDAPGGPLFDGPPACLAARRGHVESLQHLVAARARLDGSGSADRWTPLHHAAAQGHVKCVSVLLAGHPTTAKVNERGGLRNTIATHQDLLANRADAHGRLPLHVAAARAQADCVEVLIRQGHTLLDEVDADGDGALHMAARASTERGAVAVCDLIGLARADINLRAAEGETALHVAAEKGRARLCTVLLGHRADACVVEAAAGRTALHCAAHAQSHEACSALLAGRADPHLLDATHSTPLMRARSEECKAVLGVVMRGNERHRYALTHDIMEIDGGGLAH